MSPRRRHSLELEQLWYGWSQENLDGSRGYGVIAASPGWKALLDSGSDVLGPAVAFPDVPTDRVPPASGAFMRLRGTPVVVRRVPLGSDDLSRPGSYGVRVVLAPDAPADAPLDALTAARLLASGVLDGPPPPPGDRDLDRLAWSPPATGDGPAQMDHRALVALLAAVLQGMHDEQQVSVRIGDEPDAARLLAAVFALLPRPWLADRSFSTFETGAARPSLRVVCRLDGWDEAQGGAPGTSAIALNLTSQSTDEMLQAGVARADAPRPGELRPEMLRWARMLVDRQGAPWVPDAPPADVAALGALLDSVELARAAPHALTADELTTLGRSTALATWAGGSGAHHAAVRALREVSPARLGDLLAATAKDSAAWSVMVDAAWECVEADSEGSTAVANAELLLRHHGVAQNDIDVARVRHLPSRATDARYDAADSRRVVTVLLARPGGLADDDWSNLARVTWDRGLRTEYPSAWLQTVLRDPAARGPVMTDTEAARLPSSAIAAALEGAVDAGVGVEEAGRRLSRVLPSGRRERVRVLTLASQVPGIGMSAVFLGALAGTDATDADRTALLHLRWARFVDEAGMPGYLADAMVPRRSLRGPALTRRGVVALVVLVAVAVAAVVLGVLALRP